MVPLESQSVAVRSQLAKRYPLAIDRRR